MKKNLFLIALTLLSFTGMPSLFAASAKAVLPEKQATFESLSKKEVSAKEVRMSKKSNKRMDRLEKKIQRKMDRLHRKGKMGGRFSLGFVGLIVMLVGGLFIVLGLVIPAIGILFLVIGIIIAFVGLLLMLLLNGLSVDVS